MLSPIRDASTAVLIASLTVLGCASGKNVAETIETVDVELMLQDLSRLSHDSLEGRRTGSKGNEQARRYIAREFAAAGLTPYQNSFEQPFEVISNGSTISGVNVVGSVAGAGASENVMVISAHFDHLGIRDGVIYNGADDNASGTAALLALARRIATNPLQHSVIFLAVDAEELGLQGARAFVANPPVPRDRIAIDVNLDMVGHSDSVLFAAGTHHYPEFREALGRVVNRSPIVLRLGHDRPGLLSGEDWTDSSDHGPFHAAGIPFVYFGVEDHPDYHEPSDDFETINKDFYAGAVATILDAVRELDNHLATAGG